MTYTIESLRAQHCKPRRGEDARLPTSDLNAGLAVLPGWSLGPDGRHILKEFRFADYYRTMAFVNAVASIAHREDHHPDLEVHYDRCLVRYSTHDANGLSLNDLVSAAHVEDLVVVR